MMYATAHLNCATAKLVLFCAEKWLSEALSVSM